MNRLKIILSLVLISGLLLAGCSAGTGQSPSLGKQAPDFQLPDLEGQPVSLSSFRGQPVLLNFWASWCAPCRYEMPFLQEIHEEWTGKSPSVVVLAVNIGESSSKVNEFINMYNLSFPVLLDTKQDIARKYNIRAIPTTFLIDKDGIIQAIKVGAFSNKTEIEKNLSKIVP